MIQKNMQLPCLLCDVEGEQELGDLAMAPRSPEVHLGDVRIRQVRMLLGNLFESGVQKNI